MKNLLDTDKIKINKTNEINKTDRNGMSLDRRIVFLAIALFIVGLCLTGCGNQGSSVEETHVEATWVEPTTGDAGDDNASDESNDDEYHEPISNPCWMLSVPTQITKVRDLYFIVDCYNNQAIYNDNITDPINEWSVMTSDIVMGHTVASDGEVYLVDDTENNRVLVLEYNGSTFELIQVFENIGVRPHYIVYDETDHAFYAWSSMTGQMYVFEHAADSKQMYMSRIMKIDELDGVYVRSFTIDGDSIYLVSGNSQIIEARKSDFKILNKYVVPPELAGMIQIMPIPSGYYITISTDVNGNQDFATIIYTEKLTDLEDGKYTDIYASFVGGGTPYYMGVIDGRYYLTEHRIPGHSIWSFDIDDSGMPVDVVAVY